MFMELDTLFMLRKKPPILSLGNEARDISLFTELLVKEDLLQLIGFLTQTEKDWFNLLRSVQGMEAKVALTI